MREKYTVIDLFAGAGGLSSGFEQTNKFIIKAAVENNKAARETYKANHDIGDAISEDIKDVDYTDIKHRFKKIDVVIGGPPCQGFSNANRQHNCAINQNNLLVKEYVRAVLSLQPEAFVLENVGMLRSNVHKFLVEKNDKLPLAITVKEESIVLLDKAYTSKDVIICLPFLDHATRYKWTDEDYLLINGLVKKEHSIEKAKTYFNKHKKQFLAFAPLADKDVRLNFLNKETKKCRAGIRAYCDQIINLDELIFAMKTAIMLQRMLGKIEELKENSICYRLIYSDGIKAKVSTYSVFEYLRVKFHQAGYGIKSGVLCAADYGVPQKRFRFVILGIKHMSDNEITLPKKTCQTNQYYTVRDAIGDLESVKTSTNIIDGFCGVKVKTCKNANRLYRKLHNCSTIYNHVVTSSRKNALTRFKALKQGENFHALSDDLKKNTYSDVSRTQNTIYQRLDYNKPSGTVVNVRKSMWIHPVLNRAISIREAARLQSFPDNFKFLGTKDAQYQQVGNAVPPLMAKAIALNLYSLLKRVKRMKE